MGTHTVSDLMLGSEGAEASVSKKSQREARGQQQRDGEGGREKRRETCESYRDRDREIVSADSLRCAMLIVPALSRTCCFGRVL